MYRRLGPARETGLSSWVASAYDASYDDDDTLRDAIQRLDQIPEDLVPPSLHRAKRVIDGF
jgi:hypothetical protein